LRSARYRSELPVLRGARNTTLFEEGPPLPQTSRPGPMLPRAWLDDIGPCTREALSRHAPSHRF
jgi:hypothetical protein